MKRTDNPIFTPEQKTLIAEHILKGAPEFELERFYITCERTGLDPFSRQIYGRVQRTKVKRAGTKDQFDWIPVVVIITSIDGFRAIAERSGQYRGQSAPEWYGLDEDTGKLGWHSVFLAKRDNLGNPITLPDACRVGVFRDGFEGPCYGVANFQSFAAYEKSDGGAWYLGNFWKRMPEHMIAKVAEAQAIRKAFPLLACGLYVEEEVKSSDDDEEIPVPPQAKPEALPDGATWVAGHSPEERKEVAAKTDEPKAEPKSTTRKKAEPKPPEPTIEPPKEEVNPELSKAPDASEADPLSGGSDIPPADADNGNSGWQSYVIKCITIPAFKGRKLEDLSPAEVRVIKVNWVEKHAVKIKMSPEKVKEAEMIMKAFAAHGGN